MWSLNRTTAPTDLPVTLGEIKDHLRVDHEFEDALIFGLLRAAVDYVEDASGRSLLTQTWTLTLDGWPDGTAICLARPPIASVASVKYYDGDGTPTTWSSGDYDVDTAGARVVLGYNKTWPTGTLRPSQSVAVEYVAGYGAREDVPETYKHAIKLLVGHWYVNREASAVGSIRDAPLAFKTLVSVDRHIYEGPE